MSHPTEATSLPVARPAGLGRWLALTYGVLSYATFLAVFSALALWVGGVLVPYSVDRGFRLISVGSSFGAVLVNLALIAAFGVQHSIMARRGFKRWITRLISPAIERSTFMFASSLVLLAIMLFWQPLTATIWNVSHPVGAGILWALFAIGWLGAVASSFMINHFELFGLMQIWTYATGQPLKLIPFKAPMMYRWVRHPMMFFIFIGFWATPHMTVGHALVAIGFTLYVLIGVWFEERDLLHRYGDDYRRYQESTPQYLPRVFGDRSRSA